MEVQCHPVFNVVAGRRWASGPNRSHVVEDAIGRVAEIGQQRHGPLDKMPWVIPWILQLLRREQLLQMLPRGFDTWCKIRTLQWCNPYIAYP